MYKNDIKKNIQIFIVDLPKVGNMVTDDQKKENQMDKIKEFSDAMVKDFDKKIKNLKEKKDSELNKVTDEKVKEFMAYWMKR